MLGVFAARRHAACSQACRRRFTYPHCQRLRLGRKGVRQAPAQASLFYLSTAQLRAACAHLPQPTALFASMEPLRRSTRRRGFTPWTPRRGQNAGARCDGTFGDRGSPARGCFPSKPVKRRWWSWTLERRPAKAPFQCRTLRRGGWTAVLLGEAMAAKHPRDFVTARTVTTSSV